MADRPKSRSRSTTASLSATESASEEPLAAPSPQDTASRKGKGSAAKTSGSRAAAQADATSSPIATGADPDPDWLADVEGLSFQEARTALELAMARLQSDALEVEEMAGLYRRAEAYAQRCEAVLQQVEQEVIQWDITSTPPPP